MSVININKKAPPINTFALLNLGFRPFFLAAAIFATTSIILWAFVYFSYITLPMRPLSNLQWHSHEMIYGYSLAVIAGFLLTAIMNWTGIRTLHGKPLLALIALWVIARLSFLFGTYFLELAALTDILFSIGLTAAVAIPIFKAKQWKQLGVLSKVLILTLAHICFYLGAFGLLEHGVYWGIYGGLYTIIALILTIGGRVIPTFIRNGIDYEVTITNPIWGTVVSLILYIPFLINQLFIHDQTTLGYLSSALFLVTTLRLLDWHTSGIWRKPLLWSLYLSIVFIDLGFLLFALHAFIGISPFLAIHAFAYGGIGIATLGMMSRVALGHTGRNIRTPSKMTTYALTVLAIGALIRVVFPLFDQIHYNYWIFLSQLTWIIAFMLFIVSYSKILVMPRKDGLPG